MDAAQVRDQLLAEILEDDPAVERRFDEYALVRRLGAPRSVVRAALASLAETELITRVPRVGTSLVKPPFFWSMERGTHDRSVPREPVYRTISVQKTAAPSSIAERLMGDPDAELTRVQRVTEIDGRSVEHWIIWTSLELPAEAFDEGLPTDTNWYEYLRWLTGERSFTMSQRTIDCRASDADGELLDITPGDPIRFISRRLSVAGGALIDLAWGRIDAQVVVADETFTITV